MNIAVWLMSMVGPLVVRGLISLSFTAVLFTGVTELVASLVSSAQSSWSAMPLAVLQLITLCGIPQVIGMLFGSLSARVAMWVSVGASRYVFKK